MNKKYVIVAFLIFVLFIALSSYGVDKQKANNQIKKANDTNTAETDAVLRSIWEKMKAEVISGNYEKALEYYHESTKQKYRETFNALGDKLKAIFQLPEKLTLIEIDEGLAKYNYVVTEERGNYSYPLVFMKDSDGNWKILQY